MVIYTPSFIATDFEHSRCIRIQRFSSSWRHCSNKPDKPIQISLNMTLSFSNRISRVFPQKFAHCSSSSLAWGAKRTDVSLHLSMQMRPQSRTPHQVKNGTGQLQMVYLCGDKNGVKASRRNWEGAPAKLQGLTELSF